MGWISLTFCIVSYQFGSKWMSLTFPIKGADAYLEIFRYIPAAIEITMNTVEPAAFNGIAYILGLSVYIGIWLCNGYRTPPSTPPPN